MRIIILGTAWPYRGGLAAFNERLARQYQAEGHEVEIVTFTLQYPKLLFPGKTQYSDEPAPRGLKIVRRLNAINPFSWIATGRYIRKQKPDLLITPFWLPFMAPSLGTAARAARSQATSQIALLHNLIPHEKRMGDKLLSRYFLRPMDAMVTLSRSVLTECDQFDPQHKKPRAYCPHPLYDHYGDTLSKVEARQMIGLPSDGRHLLFFGFIREYKGLDLLLEAMADKRIAAMDIKLIVAGEFYGDPKPYMEQIERLGIADRVILHTDFIPDHEVNRYFCAADVVVQPYKSATQSGVTQIAFHFEKPMVVTNVGGLPEIVPNEVAGFVTEPNASALADAIVRFYDEEWEMRLTQGVANEKRKYAWDKMTSTITHLMQRK